jgi:hypothetical protein
VHTMNEGKNFLKLSLLVDVRCYAYILTVRRDNQYIPSKAFSIIYIIL